MVYQGIAAPLPDCPNDRTHSERTVCPQGPRDSRGSSDHDRDPPAPPQEGALRRERLQIRARSVQGVQGQWRIPSIQSRRKTESVSAARKAIWCDSSSIRGTCTFAHILLNYHRTSPLKMEDLDIHMSVSFRFAKTSLVQLRRRK